MRLKSEAKFAYIIQFYYMWRNDGHKSQQSVINGVNISKCKGNVVSGIYLSTKSCTHMAKWRHSSTYS